MTEQHKIKQQHSTALQESSENTNRSNRKELESSISILKHALPKMTDLDIPPTPENYAVWYEYSQGSSLKLNAEIDNLISHHDPFSPALNHKLYLDYIAPNHCEVLEHTHNDTKRLVQSLMNKIEHMHEGARHYSSELQHFQESLSADPDIDTLSRLVANLLDETEKVNESNHQMKSSLAKMNQQVSELKQNMVALTQKALTDSLTGLANRRAFDDRLRLIFEVNAPFCLLILDIDHFKVFNDTFGHSVGDKVLIYVAETLNKAVKGDDFVARFGGEEFVILLPDTKQAGGVAVAEQIRKKISRKKLSTDHGKIEMGHVTISIGVTQNRNTDNSLSIIERADKALYMAKNSGRNKVVGDHDL